MEGGAKKAKKRRKKVDEVDESQNSNGKKRFSLKVKVKKTLVKKEEKREIVTEENKRSEPERYLETNFFSREEREKSMLMWSGVIFFMVVIVIVWVFTFKTTFKTDDNGQSSFNWDELNKITDDLSKNFDESKQQFQAMKDALTKATENASSTQINAPTSTEPVELTPEKLNLLKTKIIELEKATTTKKE